MTIEKFKKKEDPIKALQSLAYNRIMPHSIEFERTILGTLLLPGNDCIYQVMEILQPDDFYLEIHKAIYQACLNLFERSCRADIILVCEELKSMGELENVGGAYYVTQCTNDVVSHANIEAHSLIVKQKSIRRKTINDCAVTIQRMFRDDNDVFEVLDYIEDRLYINRTGILVRHPITMPEIGKKFLEQVDKAWIEGMTGIPTGIPAIDDVTQGLQPGTLTIIAARNRHGKSALAMAIMQYCSRIKNPAYPHLSAFECQYPGAYMSIEMMDTEVYARLVSAELMEMNIHIPYTRFKSGKKGLSEQDLIHINQAVERLSNRSMYIDDTADFNLITLKAKIRNLVRKYGVKFVIVDYAQLMKSSAVNKNTTTADTLAEIAKVCKALAKEFEIAIILLSQIDRNTEKHDPRPPVAADMKGSGIEDFADYIFLCWRPELWNELAVDEETGLSDKGILYVNLAKHKQGKLHRSRVPFEMDTNSYGDMSIIDGHEKVKEYFEKRETAV